MKAISPHQYNHSGGSHIVPVHSNSKLPPKTPFFTSSHLTTHTSPLLILRPPHPPPSSSSSSPSPSPSPFLPHLSLKHLTNTLAFPSGPSTILTPPAVSSNRRSCAGNASRKLAPYSPAS